MKAYLLVQRVYGSQGKIEITYRSQGVSADRGLDYITTETNAIIMEPGEISALIMIQVGISFILLIILSSCVAVTCNVC